jgi:pseudaminic acid biosynthesis-associated methylase
MGKSTKQIEEWSGEFGEAYTTRNAVSLEKMESMYKGRYGLTRAEMNYKFIGGLNRDAKILEVGSNAGNQLVCLQEMGFKNLYSIELQSYAVRLSKTRTQGINIVQGSALNIPFKDGFFDLVFTSGVLIHIAPREITVALEEIYRCSRKYIWCFEYYAKEYTSIIYRGSENLLWKADYLRLFLERFDNLELVKKGLFGYMDSDNVDAMFLLQR